jgi:hypothetical protein
VNISISVDYIRLADTHIDMRANTNIIFIWHGKNEYHTICPMNIHLHPQIQTINSQNGQCVKLKLFFGPKEIVIASFT